MVVFSVSAVIHPTMTQWFECFDCRKVGPILSGAETKCAACGSVNGEILSAERFKEGFDAGVYFNIDPRTGKPAKRRRK
jgi:hypothetical protein